MASLAALVLRIVPVLPEDGHPIDLECLALPVRQRLAQDGMAHHSVARTSRHVPVGLFQKKRVRVCLCVCVCVWGRAGGGNSAAPL